MSEHDPNREQQEQPSYTPASFEKRTAAWMGLAYVLMVLFLITYTIYTARTLPGTFPLFLVPAAAAGLVVAIYRQRKGTAPGGLPLTAVMCVICAAALALGLALGVPALIGGLTAPLG